MITLIHGEDLEASRKKLQEEIENAGDCEIIRLDGDKIQMVDLVQAVESSSMLFEKRKIIIENLLKGLLNKAKLEFLTYLAKFHEVNDIILWEDHGVEKNKIIKYFPEAQNYSFNYPPLLFKFLDSIGCVNTRQILPLFHNLLQQKDAGLIFFMLLRQWRYLIIARDLESAGLTDLAPWQAGKFVKQASYFTLEKLIGSYRQLLMIDYQTKTSSSPLTTGELLDIFFINL